MTINDTRQSARQRRRCQFHSPQILVMTINDTRESARQRRHCQFHSPRILVETINDTRESARQRQHCQLHSPRILVVTINSTRTLMATRCCAKPGKQIQHLVATRCCAPSAAPSRRQRIATYRTLAKPNFAADTGQAFQPRQERRQGERREEEGKERR